MRSLVSGFTTFWARFVLMALALGAPSVLRAVGDDNIVGYDPVSQGVFGQLPASSSYVLSVTCPMSASTFPQTVTVVVTPTTWPIKDAPTASTYVSLSSPTIRFDAPGQTVGVTVSLNFPLSSLTPAVPAAAYMYQVNTVGWVDDVVDPGATINAQVAMPGISIGNPPTLNITSPNDGATFTYNVGSFPVSIPFTFQAGTDSASPVISSVVVQAGATGSLVDVPALLAGLGSASVTGSGNIIVSGPGSYSIQATATNAYGSATDTNTITVSVTAAPPTVVINSPTPGSTYTHRLGDPATMVPFTFTAKSNYGGIRTLTALVDGQSVAFIPVGLNTLTATGSISLPYINSGSHTVSVTTTDDYGQASAQSNFTINVVAPTPTIAITTPTEGQTFQLATGVTSMNVPFSFVTTSNNGFVVDTVSATLNGNSVTLSTIGLGTALATSSGTFASLPAGSYTFTANGSSAGLPVTQTVHFTIKAAQPPPTVVINTPAPNATFQRYATGPALSIPMTFTGTSNATNGVITAVTATLDGVPLVFTPVLGTKTVVNTATMSVTTAGTHTIKVTATDYVGTATATQTFTVTVLQAPSLSGSVYFDANTNNVFDGTEPGLPGVTVTLTTSAGQVLGTATTSSTGAYTFNAVLPGNYVVTATPPSGLLATSGNARSVTVSGANVTGVNIGYMIDFCRLQGMTAGGFTIGYWKNNVDKAIAGKTSGIQVSAATIKSYTTQLGTLAIPTVYSNVTMKQASGIMGSTSSAPVDLLSKQLVASEYNYVNGAYLNGNVTLTFLFVYWGESIVANPTAYSSSYILWAQKWFDAYNNTHGGAICGPALLGTSCTGAISGGCGGTYTGGCN